jgi:hypothetical protein
MIGSLPDSCPRCGTIRISAVAPFDLCPACLLTTALSIENDVCPYQVLTPIGESPGAVIYLAERSTPGRGYVALKVLHRRDDVDDILTRYQHWKDRLGGFHHPGVARLLDVGLNEDGRLYLASDYVAGWPLSAIASRPSVGIDERTEIVRQLTAAIAAIHAVGLAHLRLTAAKVKISTASGLRATVLGLGSSLVVDGAECRREPDLAAVADLTRILELEP